MKKLLHKMGKFYSSIIIKNIGIFIFIGLLFVVFNEQGWFPNTEIYAISEMVYNIILPALIGYEAGKQTGGQTGGILAVLAVAGIVAADDAIGILGGMILGPVAGVMWKHSSAWLSRWANSSLQMLVRNVFMGVLGAALAISGYYLLSPILGILTAGVGHCVDYLVTHKIIAALSIIIEPAKVFFLNNIMNHGILVPLGMNQVQESGQSILFLLESNPGPGLGMMAALYYGIKKRRKEYAAAMFAQAAGGLHEVYFPFVLSDMMLLIPLIAGGFAGNLCFEFLGSGLQGPVSPGSVITILIMAGKGQVLRTAVGIAVSAIVAFCGSLLVLKIRGGYHADEETAAAEEIQELQDIPEQDQKEENRRQEIERMPILKVGFVCDAGVGSSAMGASLFRRKLAQTELHGLQVQPYAADQIPQDLDLIVCQKDFYELLPEREEQVEVCTVSNLMASEEYTAIIEKIQRRNR